MECLECINQNLDAKEHKYKAYYITTSLLKETRYNEEIPRIIQTTMDKQNTGLSKGELWDWCKIKIKVFSINFGRIMAQKKN